MTRYRAIWLLSALLPIAAIAATIGGSGVSGLRTHNHSLASSGGAVLAPASISATGAVSGATLTAISDGIITGGQVVSGGSAGELTLKPRDGTGADGRFYNPTGDNVRVLIGANELIWDASGKFSSTTACASGYTRVTPNLCFKNANTANIGTVLTAGTCTSIAAPDGAAKALLLRVNSLVNSNNAIATRWSQIDSHSTSACNGTTAYFRFNNQVREFAAVAAGTTISDQAAQYVVPVPVWLILTRDTGNQGTGLYEVQGYYD